MGLIDSHAHLTFSELHDDIHSVLHRSIEAGVDGWITVGTDKENNEKALRLASEFENIWATVGFHPHDAKDVTQDDLEHMREQAGLDSVVAIGEIGLDYHYNFSSPEDQKRIFIEQLKIAEDLKKPVVIHSREAFEDTIEILDSFAGNIDKILFHCFGGDAEQARVVIEKGYYISFTGVVTFKNADEARAAAKIVPLDKMMVETDCPYMSPAPMRKQKVNEPALMIHTAVKLAEIKGVSLEEFTKITSVNTKDFFLLGSDC